MVELWYQPNEIFGGGFRSGMETVEAALAQALSDIGQGQHPGPDRIVADGKVVYDRDALERAAGEAG
jgi:hypothetical protein